MPVAVVTDSTAYLPPGLADARGIRTVALEVRLGERTGREGLEIGTAEHADHGIADRFGVGDVHLLTGQRQVAEDCVWAERREDELLAVGREAIQTHAA